MRNLFSDVVVVFYSVWRLLQCRTVMLPKPCYWNINKCLAILNTWIRVSLFYMRVNIELKLGSYFYGKFFGKWMSDFQDEYRPVK